MSKVKYVILRVLDVCGFTFLDPIVRLIFGEEPTKQIQAISKYVVVPVMVFAIFLVVWGWLAPRHTTKSGEVPTPSVVWDAAVGTADFNRRESAKKRAYTLSTKQAATRLAKAEARMAELEGKLIPEAQAKIESLVAKESAWLLANVAPFRERLEARQVALQKDESSLKAEIEAKAKSLINPTADERGELLSDIRKYETLRETNKKELNQLKAAISLMERKQFPPMRAAQQDLNRLQEERQFLVVFTDILKNTRGHKVQELQGEIDALLENYNQTAASQAYREARNVVRLEDRLETTLSSSYSSAKTLPYQTMRSLLCVFAGFLFSTVIAIPIGILCGLNRIFMAAITPFIALFKPVSPIVWLPIALIVVGGFIPDPENNYMLAFVNSLPLIGEFEINPAFLASAITVALCSVWPTLVNTALGVAAIDKDHINVARVLRLGFWSRLCTIVIPSALPLIFAGLRISLGVGWMVLIAAELLSSSEGIGKFVWDMFNNGSSSSFAQMFVVVFLVGLIGLMLDRIMIVFQRLVTFDGAPTSL